MAHLDYCTQYEDEDRDKVVLATDDDLAAAVDHARMAGWKARFRDHRGFNLFRLNFLCSASSAPFSFLTMCADFAGPQAVLGLFR